LQTPEASTADGKRVCQPNVKEQVMNETLDLEVVDLGDAKEVTMGPIAPNPAEDHPVLIFRED
jgi:hypothetical protein